MLNRPVLVLSVLLALAALPLPVTPPALASGGGGSLPAFADYRGPEDETFFPDEFSLFILAGEPSIGVNWNTGKTFFQHGFETYRVAFNDTDLTATWTDVTPPTSEFNVDPILFTDATTGRTYAGGLDGMCSILAFTDDDGANWLPVGNACVATLDHESIVSGPWLNGVRPAQAIHPRAVYYCAQAQVVTCVTSFDGGFTFPLTAQVGCGFVDPGFHGSLHVAPNGIPFLPFRNCGGKIGVAFSLTNGRNWQSSQVPGSVTSDNGFDPDVASTPNGWVYIGYRNGTGGAFASLTKNNGTTWSKPYNVSASLGLHSTTFHEMVAGDNDRAALAFLGTSDPGDPFDPSFTGAWHLYVATTYDAGANWTTQKVSTDPVQRGWICDGGTGCDTSDAGHRNLLDFMDAQIDKEGRILVGYVDGCIRECAAPDGTPAQSFRNAAIITRQVSGKTLFAAYDGLFESLRALPGGPYSGSTGVATPLAGKAVGGTSPYAYAWSVASAPAGSTASFSDPAIASPTFTPDLEGAYTLSFAVTDATPTTVTATTTLVAAAPQPPGPPLEDPAGDAGLPGTDITAARIVGEDTDFFTVVLDVADLAAAIPSTAAVLDIPFGADTIYSVGWNYAENATNTVRYQVSASQYNANLPSGSPLRFELEVVGQGATGFVTRVATVSGTWDADAGTISWVVPKSEMVILRAPTGAADPGVLTGGRTPAAGDAFTAFDAEARTWVFALVGLGPGFTIWDSATGTGSYELTG